MSDDNFLMAGGERANELRQYRTAFEGFTGPLNAVQPGDFHTALQLLNEYFWLVRGDTDKGLGKKAAEFLDRLQVTSDPETE